MKSFVIVGWLLVVLVGADVRADEPIRARVAALTAEHADQVRAWRRHIHAHPELSNREKETARYVAERLQALGVDRIQTGLAHHGVVALIKGAHPGKVVALRADMDALPVTEATGLSFASRRKGVMHACGHDVHTAVLLGAAAVLVRMRAQLHGTVKLIFQPAEEGPPPGEKGGASLMVEEGVLERPKVDAIFGLHTFPELAAGELGYTLGGAFASVDRFEVVVHGKQTHAAYPGGGIDPIVTAAHIITGLQTIVSRTVDPRHPVVVSVGTVRGGQRWNIIPETVTLEGTVRTQDKRIRALARKTFHRVVHRISASQGAKATIRYEDLAPVTWNDPALGRRMLPTLHRSVGAANTTELLPAMGGEDFAFYAQKVPGFTIRLGVGDPKRSVDHPLHTPTFYVNEQALPVGVRTMALFALDFLKGS